MREAGRLCWISLTLVFLAACSSRVSAYVGFWEPFEDYDHSWAGMGSVSLDTTGCIVSNTANSEWEVSRGGGQARDYRLRIDPLNAFFTLSNSTYTLPVGFSVTDLHGSGTQVLSPSQFSDALTYNQYCTTLGPNARLTLSIAEPDLYAVPAGTYTASFDLTAERIGGGGGSSSASASLSASVVIPTLVQISNLDNINFGTYDGVSSVLAQNESFCVYSNVSDYTITPSTSTSGDATGSYAMVDGSGDHVEYSVKLDNSPNGASGQELGNGETSMPFSVDFSSPLSRNCNGTDNAAIFVEIQGSELRSRSPGSYTGTITLEVSPI